MRITCAGCGTSKESKPTTQGSVRLPKGWKHHPYGDLCSGCWKDRFLLRAITLPVAFPIDRKSKELWECLGKAWAQTTQLANWVVTELAKADVTRKPGEAKMAAMPNVYLYPDARRLWPELNPRSVVSILHSVTSRYRKRRLEAVWRSSESLPSYRYPMPYPTHNQAWKLERENQGLVVSLTIGGEPWKLRLRGGHEFRRQIASLEKIISGEAIQGELALYRQRANQGDRRANGAGREEGERSQWRIMCKVVAWLPRESSTKVPSEKQVELKTTRDRFWIAADGDWVLNADCVRHWIRGYERMRQRMAEDRKPALDHRRQLRDLRLKGTKHHNRIKSFCQMSVSAFVRWAVRSGYGSVVYDDTDQSYFPSFPWHQLRTDLTNKCDEVGLKLEVKEKEEAKPDATPEEALHEHKLD
jgi:hypothetical protein